MKASAWFAASSFHTPRPTPRAAETPSTYVDTRPRVKYVMPDGRPATIIVDHGETPRETIDLEIVESDPLWSTATRRAGTSRRFVTLRLARGM